MLWTARPDCRGPPRPGGSHARWYTTSGWRIAINAANSPASTSSVWILRLPPAARASARLPSDPHDRSSTTSTALALGEQSVDQVRAEKAGATDDQGLHEGTAGRLLARQVLAGGHSALHAENAVDDVRTRLRCGPSRRSCSRRRRLRRRRPAAGPSRSPWRSTRPLRLRRRRFASHSPSSRQPRPRAQRRIGGRFVFRRARRGWPGGTAVAGPCRSSSHR